MPGLSVPGVWQCRLDTAGPKYKPVDGFCEISGSKRGREFIGQWSLFSSFINTLLT